VDYRQVLDASTFALFSRLRDLRKTLAEQENVPPYAVFTNEQLAEIAKRRCDSPAALGKINGIGTARVEKYGAILVATLLEHDKQQGTAGAGGGSGKPA
jgi:superfamily II DNA helicase RecQ